MGDDLFDVIHILNPIAASWKHIGRAMHLNVGELDCINSESSRECLSCVVEKWLKRNYNDDKFGQPTWKWLVEIVADPAAGNNKHLADEIAREHLNKKEGKNFMGFVL